MHLYEVGKPYSATRQHWTEGADYNYRSGEHELRLFFRKPSPTEIAGVKRGLKQFALFTQGDVNVLLYKIGSMPWSDQPFSVHLTEQGVGPQDLPPPLSAPDDATYRAALQIVLVDADTGLIRAMNMVTFSPEFTRALHAAIRDQASRPWPGDAEYNRQVAAIQARYPDSFQLAEECSVRCVGGRD